MNKPKIKVFAWNTFIEGKDCLKIWLSAEELGYKVNPESKYVKRKLVGDNMVELILMQKKYMGKLQGVYLQYRVWSKHNTTDPNTVYREFMKLFDDYYPTPYWANEVLLLGD